MIIAVGSTNPVKIEAVKKVLSLYPSLSSADVRGLKVSSNVHEQPTNLDMILTGARNRAEAAFQIFRQETGTLGIGIEGGITPVPYCGYMHHDGAVIFDGTAFHHGISPGYEVPPDLVPLLLSGMTFQDAFRERGYTTKPEIGREEGAIGVLTGMRIDRVHYTIPALILAMAAYELRQQHAFSPPDPDHRP